MPTVFKTLILVSGVTAWTATAAAAAEYQCQKRDSSLRVAIEVKKAGHTLPCEVVVEDDRGERVVLYSAQFDRSYCPSRIEKTKSELEQDGWRCQQTSLENIVRRSEQPDEPAPRQAAVADAGESGSGGALLARNGKVIAASRQCRKQDDLRRIRIEVEDANRGKPCELIYWADGDQTKPGQMLWRAEHDASFCPSRLDVIIEKWVSEGWQCDEADGVQTAAAVPAPQPGSEAGETVPAGDGQAEAEQPTEADQGADDPATVDPELQAVVTADAERIGEWMEVEPAIEIAAHGDLNDDGSDDAVVFLAYQSDQAAYRQYLMSYLVADDGYELASVKLLTGVNPPPAQARVQQIDEGVIWITLPDENGASAEQTGYRLRDQQLVEVAPESGAEADD